MRPGSTSAATCTSVDVGKSPREERAARRADLHAFGDIGDEHVELHDIVHRRPGGFQQGLDAAERNRGLREHRAVTADAAVFQAGELPGNVDRVAGDEALRE